MSTQKEEVIVNAYLIEAKKLLPKIRNLALDVVAGRNEWHTQIRPPMRSSWMLLPWWGISSRGSVGIVLLDQQSQILCRDCHLRKPRCEDPRKCLRAFLCCNALGVDFVLPLLEIGRHLQRGRHPNSLPRIPVDGDDRQSSVMPMGLCEGVHECVCSTVVNMADATHDRR